MSTTHIVWIINKFSNALLMWFAYWVYFRSTSAMNIAEFFLAMLMVIVLYIQVLLLVTRYPERVDDWNAHFFAIRRSFFALNLLFVPIGLLLLHVVASIPFPGQLTVAYAAIAAMSIVGMTTANRAAHGTIAILVALNQFGTFARFMFDGQ